MGQAVQVVFGAGLGQELGQKLGHGNARDGTGGGYSDFNTNSIKSGATPFVTFSGTVTWSAATSNFAGQPFNFDNRANDHLFGGAGADVFTFSNSGVVDLVHDLNLAEGDIIRVAANINGTGVATTADLLARLTAVVAGDAILDLGGGNAVRIVGVAPIQLAAGDLLPGKHRLGFDRFPS